jgi:exopolysaccharide/PEP-CTERM locus tyrosine autokinase
MSIIEQATRRLEELKRAGIEVPTWDTGAAVKDERRPLAEPKAAPTQARFTAGSELRGAELRAERALRPAGSNALVQVGQRQSKSVEVDIAQLANAGYLVPGSPRSTLADEFRGIKQPVLKNARPDAEAPIRLGNLIMVTSALPGEGKTFCALNLALSIASEVDSSVLLVDADVVRPAILERLGLTQSGQSYKGLLDLLTDPTLDLSEVILKTNVPKLSVLPAGTPRINSTELLASNSMQELLADISSRYADRIVIFDAPPLLATTESRVLAARMGQILMVVNEGATGKDDIAQAFASVQACPIVLSLLNRSSSSSEMQQYGYGDV